MEDLQVVVFALENEEYGIPINKVHEIIKTPERTKVPNAPYFIEGVINLRGEIIPIIDLRKLFKMKNLYLNDQSQIVIIEIKNHRVGVMVDDVNEVIKLTAETIDQPPDILKIENNSLIMGIGKIEKRLLILLNTDAILSRDADKEEFIQFQQDVKAETGN